MIDAATRRLVRERAGNRCEYCKLHQDHSPLATLQIEHINPRKHGGTDDIENLALACIDCNLSKSSNIAGRDPQSSGIIALFDPRRDVWADHLFEATIRLSVEVSHHQPLGDSPRFSGESDCRPDRANRRRAGTAIATENAATMETVQWGRSGLRCSGSSGDIVSAYRGSSEPDANGLLL